MLRSNVCVSWLDRDDHVRRGMVVEVQLVAKIRVQATQNEFVPSLAFTILSDPNAEVIRRYHLLHAGGGPEGHDIARPAEFLVDSSRVVPWVNLTEDVRVRARADEMLAAAKDLR